MKKAYEVGSDNLVLGGHDIDVKNTPVDVSKKTEAGVIKRGQVIDYSNASGYTEHSENGKVNRIAECDVSYGAGDNTVIVPCYITGSYRKNELVTGVELTETDEEEFRSLGIILG